MREADAVTPLARNAIWRSSRFYSALPRESLILRRVQAPDKKDKVRDDPRHWPLLLLK
jgi:hypothetical protein